MTVNRRRSLLIVIAAILLLLGCALVAGVYWGVGPSLRCKIPAQGPIQPGWSVRAVLSGDRERCYHLYVPPGRDPAQPAPLVVSLHGFLSNPDSQTLIAGWPEFADGEGFLVVYPQGTSFPQRWNAGATWGVDEIDDVQFFRDVLDDLSALTMVDRSRIYVNGFSNGGGMALRIGCEAADQVAALGVVAAAVVDIESCSPARPLPLMAFHGTADPIVNYGGGDMYQRPLRDGAELTRAPTYFVGVEEWVAAWARGNGCNPVPQLLPPQGDVRGRHYSECDQKADVILYTIEGGGHTWPGGWPIPGVGQTSTDVDATEEMWKFFQAYPLEKQP